MNTSVPTNYASECLENIAQEIAASAVKHPELRAILLQGSVAKSIADAYSDIRLVLA